MLLISADLDELIGLSDRLEVILRGKLVKSFDPSSVTPEDLGSAMTGADGDVRRALEEEDAAAAPSGATPAVEEGAR